jgi:hypothetical protein
VSDKSQRLRPDIITAVGPENLYLAISVGKYLYTGTTGLRRRLESQLGLFSKMVEDALDMLAGTQPVGGEIMAPAGIYLLNQIADFNIIGTTAGGTNRMGGKIFDFQLQRLNRNDLCAPTLAPPLNFILIAGRPPLKSRFARDYLCGSFLSPPFDLPFRLPLPPPTLTTSAISSFTRSQAINHNRACGSFPCRNSEIRWQFEAANPKSPKLVS